MYRHMKRRRALYSLLALAAVALTGAWVAAAEILRLSQNVPGDSKAIILHANEITTWTEGSRRVILLKGMVLAQQGVVSARMKQAVAWVDQEHTRQTGILHLDLLADGEVLLENGSDSRQGVRAHLDFNTRGELKLRCYQGKVAQQPRPEDPLYREAQALQLVPTWPQPAPAIQRASANQAVPPGPGVGNNGGAPAALPGWQPLPPAGSRPSGPPGGYPPPAPQPVVPAYGPRSDAAPVLPGFLPSFAQAPPVPTAPGQPDRPYRVVRAAMGSGPSSPGESSADVQRGPAVQPAQQPLPSPGGTGIPTLPIPGPGPPPGGNPPTLAPGPSPAAPPVPPTRAPGQPAAGTPRNLHIVPRTPGGFQYQLLTLPNGEQALVVTGGVILTVRNPAPPAPGQPNANVGLLDIEADRLVVWSRDFQNLFSGLSRQEGQTSRQAEFYLAGNVEIREQNGPESRTLRADEVYYDVGRSVAVAYRADLEFKQAGLPEPVHMHADEMYQLSPTQFKVTRAELFSSRLPSDPGLKIYVAEGTLQEKQIPKKSIFGKQVINRQTGQPEVEPQRLFRGDDVLIKVEDTPIFYLPFIQGDANDPFGPLEDLRLNYNRIFGFQFGLTFNVFDLLGVDPIPGTRWRLFTDYLSRRGPALGTEFDYGGCNLFDLPGRYTGLFKAYGIYDDAVGRFSDILGGGRGQNEEHPPWRGRILERHYQELPDDFIVQLQAAPISDRNFLEQYYENEWERDVNQETFLYVKQQRDNWAWTAIAEPRIRSWITETERLPQGDVYLIGQSFFDVFTYDAHADAGYYQLRPASPPPPLPGQPLPAYYSATDRPDNTGRFDLWQDIAIPFTLGPFRVRPFAVLDLTYYTQDLEDKARGRVYGAAGVRASIPFTRLYPDVQSDLLNLNAINHKIVATVEYYNAQSDTRYSILPQLDRMNDDATDQALRDIKPMEPVFNPSHPALVNSPLYDPQLYAIRRLEENMFDQRVDTMDTVEVVNFDVRQRLQTKRGYPGMQHTVDWMTLDTSMSVFPHSNRDNFGEPISFIEYDYTWNVGDRTTLVSTGWFDPMGTGARVWTVGSFLNRPDRTTFYLGYRQIDPLQSQAATAAVTYIFSPKYAVTGSATYDFGLSKSMSNSLVLTRMGSDLMVSVGLTYNSILNNFGFTIEILPNIVRNTTRVTGTSPFGAGPLGAPH